MHPEFHPNTLPLDRKRIAWLCVGYAALHTLAHVYAGIFAVAPGISIWYAPCGLALSVLVLLGNRFAPLVFGVNVATALTYSSLGSWWSPVLFPLLITTVTGIAASLVRNRLGGVLLPGSARTTLWFIAIILLVPALIALLGSSTVMLLGYHTPQSFLPAIFNWWVGDMSGLLTVVPAAMVFVHPWLRKESSPYALPSEGRYPLLSAAALALLLFGTLALVFLLEPLRRLHAFHLCLVPLIWIAVRYGLPGATLATLAITLGGLIGMHFFRQSLDFVGNFFLFELAVAGVGLGLGSAVTARHRLELKRLEHERRLQQMQKYESLGVLAGGIAHEFNNLLTSIVGNASLLRLDLAGNASAAQPLTQIENASWRAAELCQQMLAYAGRTPPVFHPIDLSLLIERARNLLCMPVGRNIEIEFHLSKAEAMIEADASQLRQLLTHLIVFSSDSIGERPGRIRIGTSVVTFPPKIDPTSFQIPPVPEKTYMLLEVSDDGAGVPIEVLPRLFEPFFTTKASSQGLGLATMLGTVKAHKGALSVSSVPGRGTRFLLYFPLHASDVASPETRRPAAGHLPHRNGLVLVVDDEDNVRSVVCRMLANLGYTTSPASNGAEALQIFEKKSQEILFVMLDLRMPQMDGEEVFLNLQRINPKVPVILMSGYSEKFSLDHFKSVRPAGFLAKPFDPTILRTTLEHLTTSSGR